MGTNTYAINAVKGNEFLVADKLREMGLHPWVPTMLCKKRIKEKTEIIWHDRPYIPKLLFCVVPAIYWDGVMDIKEIVGKPIELSRSDIGSSGGGFLMKPKPLGDQFVLDGNGAKIPIPMRYGLQSFRETVEAEYAAMCELRDSNEWVCGFRPGQALEILAGAFSGMTANFKEVVKSAAVGHPMLRVEMEVLGAKREVEVKPLSVAG